MTVRRLTALATTLAAATLAACGEADRGEPSTSDGGLSVVATTTQVGDLARNVAGDRASVTQILKPNSDPHEYEPRPSDVEAVAGTAVVLRSGGDLDEWLADVLNNAGNEATVVTLVDAMRTRRLPGAIDPHWWQNPRNGAIAVNKIRDALIAADPEGRDTYTANATAYLKQLDALDGDIESCLNSVPEPDRKLVTRMAHSTRTRVADTHPPTSPDRRTHRDRRPRRRHDRPIAGIADHRDHPFWLLSAKGQARHPHHGAEASALFGVLSVLVKHCSVSSTVACSQRASDRASSTNSRTPQPEPPLDV